MKLRISRLILLCSLGVVGEAFLMSNTISCQDDTSKKQSPEEKKTSKGFIDRAQAGAEGLLWGGMGVASTVLLWRLLKETYTLYNDDSSDMTKLGFDVLPGTGEELRRRQYRDMGIYTLLAILVAGSHYKLKFFPAAYQNLKKALL